MLVDEEVHSLEIPLILDERRRHPFFQLAALVDVIAAAQHNLGVFEPQLLTHIILYAQCFSHHTPRCVDMPESNNFKIHRPSLTSALVVAGLLSDV